MEATARVIAIAVALTSSAAGCRQLFGLGDLPPDAASGEPDTIADAAGDGPTTCTAYLDLCSLPAPASPIVLATAIDTSSDPRCLVRPQAGGLDVCLIYGTSVDVPSTIAVTGSRPLAIAATTTLTIEGTIDVGSQRAGQLGPAADDASCAFLGAVPQDNLGGAGGGAAGSFGSTGGDGAIGNSDMSITGMVAQPGHPGPAVASVPGLRGGCPGQRGGNESAAGGQGGNGGHGGGALYLHAGGSITLASAGEIRATGAGGDGGKVQAGGGGGGAGGLVVIEAASITIAGQISANGGGGGEGGERIGSVNTPGNPGADGAFGTTGALGGTGTPPGFGGAGGAGAASAGVAGTTSIAGGGGGGGGTGIVIVRGAASVTGVVSPAPSP